ncbi:MAG: guanylate kinase [Actinobacteria bacterium]|nr:guanylate kinase [Actinomycetota bacterium]
MSVSSSEPLVIVLCGPGGVGKGTVARRLAERDPKLWLSRSWTTRSRRVNEKDDAYYFVDRPTFEAKASSGGFMEWAEFLGNLYGTPWPDRLVITDGPDGRDILLEIDVQGATQIRHANPDALVILLVAPSQEEQQMRLEQRGDDDEHVASRMAAGSEEIKTASTIADAVVVNDSVDQAADEIHAIIEERRRRAGKQLNSDAVQGFP